MLLDMYYRHLVTMFLILLFSIKLLSRKRFQHAEARYFWVTVISCALLVLEDVLEVYASEYPSMWFFRIALSVLGYTFRSTAPLGLLLVIVPEEKRKRLLWIPSLITLLVSATAFFSDIVFGYDQNYGFYRGSLGYAVFVTPILYLLLILFNVFKRFSERKGAEKYIAPVCAVFCLAASFADMKAGGVRLTEAIMISSVLFYIVLFSHDNRLDVLTGLLNRQAFYDDCVQYGRSISAAVSMDINGLKTMNDTEGHQAGDEALKTVGACMRRAANQNTLTYRVGGDEFVVLFLRENEETVKRVEARIREDVARSGYSVSSGHLMRDKHQDLDELVRESDRLMYEDKSNYYRTSGHDRRRNRGPKQEENE